MVRGDGRRNMTGTIHDEIDAVRGRDVLQNDFKLGIVSQHRAQCPLEEYGLTVKNIDRRIHDFPVNQQRHANALHDFQASTNFVHTTHACCAVGGGIGRIELDRSQYTRLKTCL